MTIWLKLGVGLAALSIPAVCRGSRYTPRMRRIQPL